MDFYSFPYMTVPQQRKWSFIVPNACSIGHIYFCPEIHIFKQYQRSNSNIAFKNLKFSSIYFKIQKMGNYFGFCQL